MRLALGCSLDVENEHLFVVLGQFVKLVQFDGPLGTGLLAEAAENAALQVDGEGHRIFPVIISLAGLDSLDGVGRADHQAQGAGHTPPGAVLIDGEFRMAPPAGGYLPFLFRILQGDGFGERHLEGGRQPFEQRNNHGLTLDK